MLYRLLFICCSTILLISCANTKNVVYFNNIGSTEILSKFEEQQPVIQKNDILNVSISSLNPEASSLFNQPNSETVTNSAMTIGSVRISGYLVDQDGNIQLPFIGNVKAQGLTKKQLKESITKTLVDKKLLLDPIVNIRYLNFKVTVLGEVQHPNVINVANEKITLLEALGLAGDLTIFGKRENVMILREEEGKKIIHRVNLNSTDLLSSPYYYLRSNDIVYVEPNKEKVTSSQTTSARNISLILSGLSFLTTLIFIIRNR
jgi:polysaccharide export outer membrane protein